MQPGDGPAKRSHGSVERPADVWVCVEELTRIVTRPAEVLLPSEGMQKVPSLAAAVRLTRGASRLRVTRTRSSERCRNSVMPWVESWRNRG